MTRPIKKYLAFALTMTSIPAMASDFNLPFVSISGLGNTYSGWAAEAYDASTTYTNPAGLTLFTKPQIVAAIVDVTGHTQFQGTATTLFSSQTGQATATAGGYAPLLYVAAPLSNKVVFGFGVNAPFGLGTNYPKTSLVRYAATRSQIVDVDFSPSLGFKVNDKLSLGLGFDAQRLTVTLNNMYGPPLSIPDAEGQNHLAGWGYGWHGGILYQVIPTTRLGLSFNSQTMFHTLGDSEVYMPQGPTFRTTSQKAYTPLPARAQASIYHEVNPKWSVMGSVFYNRWSTLKQIILQNTMTPGGVIMPVTIPLQYHDTFDYAIGTNVKAAEKVLLRAGIQYFNTPSNDRFRSVADPVGRMILVGIGLHYQRDSRVGFDFGYAHDFFKQTVINFVTPLNTVKGHSTMGTNIFGAQVTCNI